MSQHGCLEPTEAEITCARKFRGIAIRMRQPDARQRDRAIVASRGEAVDDGTTRIPELQQFRDLVVGLSSRIVTRAAEQFVDTRLRDAVQAGMAPRYDEYNRRHRHLAALQDKRFYVSREVVHRNDRDTACPGERLRERNADEQRTDKTGTLCNRDCVNARTVRVIERTLDHSADVTNVLPR